MAACILYLQTELSDFDTLIILRFMLIGSIMENVYFSKVIIFTGLGMVALRSHLSCYSRGRNPVV